MQSLKLLYLLTLIIFHQKKDENPNNYMKKLHFKR